MLPAMLSNSMIFPNLLLCRDYGRTIVKILSVKAPGCGWMLMLNLTNKEFFKIQGEPKVSFSLIFLDYINNILRIYKLKF